MGKLKRKCTHQIHAGKIHFIFVFVCVFFCIVYQRLTSSTDAEREKTLRDIARYDLFGVRYQNGAKTRLETLLWPMGESYELRIQKYTAKLLYTITSMKSGRDYVRSVSIIRLLAWSNSICSPPMQFEHRPLVDTETAEHLVGAMGKLCTIEFHREDMINAGMLHSITFCACSLAARFV